MKNTENSCHGSNNCYVWALELQQYGKRADDSSTASNIINKCLSTTTTKHDNDDIECLLLNEHMNQGESSASDQNFEQFDETDEPNESVTNNQCDKKQEIHSASSKP